MKKQQQLGMNPSTASHRLVKDILWNLIQKTSQDNCCKCGLKMTRETFSIEHVIPWLDSEDPLALYFDLNNISFSHHACNVKDERKPTQKYFTEEERNKAKRPYDKFRVYCPIKRKERYERNGK